MNPPSVDEFVAAAREYCSFAEDSMPVSASDISKIRELLLRLIYHVPAVEAAPHGAEREGDRPGDSAYAIVANRFGSFPFNLYRVVFDPHEIDTTDEPVMAMLSDDLADIYRDLAEGLSNAEKGYLDDACSDWTLGYRSHWARHAANALMAIEVWRTDNYENVDQTGGHQPPTRAESSTT